MVNSQPQTLQEQFLLHPNNFEKKNSAIARQIDKELNGTFNLNGIGGTLGAVIDQIVNTFREQMERDGVNLEGLQLKKRGAPDVSPWQRCYHWLWDKAFPRWGFTKLQKQKQVVSKPGWLELVPNQEDRCIAVGKPNNPTQELRANQGYLFQLQVSVPGYLLLLLREKN
ncbi:MAG: hypothetical protein J7545_16810 [Roseofilum sp. SBFL]|uniref:hypothetical protein n=1 Tax=unclassified Roseofilum TaxID=2620099 RepID=UPI001B1876B5|nr:MULTISPECIES: hypothetical protein [unclassified Roseofilum]MBP0013053.1 hypothetical protein [Roseofilum sp. SID3]MBP0023111.1 hypothetical protein [Roseofilum sp. SID2]MBP0040135.1 hypothetical protein [Roseofilum sp. SID1]MBP0043607.1 hypothetical protein [Roseofilum sp. SBFL]